MSNRIVEFLKKTRRAGSENAEELILDGLKLKSFSSEDIHALGRYSASVISLSMNQCSLTSLTEMPGFPNVTVLELHDNRLDGQEVFANIATKFPKIDTLLMAGNKVSTLDCLSPLKTIESLHELDLEMNPLMSSVTRDAIFQFLPSLAIVNGYTKDGKEVEESQSSDGEGGAGDESDSMEDGGAQRSEI